MPHLQAMVERSNFAFNRENIGAVDASLFQAGVDLGQSLMQMGIIQTAEEMAFFMRFTRGERERIRVTIEDALDTSSQGHAGYRMPIQAVWIAGSDFKAEFFQSGGTADSIGGVSMVIRTPYPSGSPPPR